MSGDLPEGMENGLYEPPELTVHGSVEELTRQETGDLIDTIGDPV